MKEITVEELKSIRDNNEDHQLIDVREVHAADACNIGGVLIPMGEVMDNVDKIEKGKKVIVHCRSGKRSATVISALEAQHQLDNLYNLKGGIIAYAEKIDPSLQVS